MFNDQTVKIPLCNVYAKGDYCAQLHIGSENTAVQLILDTGSSTLVVSQHNYQPQSDHDLQATALAQEVNYGIGGWDGPVVHTSVTIHSTEETRQNDCLSLKNCPIALVATETTQTFLNADGILGLAYHHLNKGYDLSHYLAQQHIKPSHSFPWPFNSEGPLCSDDLKAFKALLWQQAEQDVIPYFNELTRHHLCHNKFALLSRRSSIYVHDDAASDNELAAQQLNQGSLIIGNAEQHQELYLGQFTSVKVEHDVYYNVNLVSVQLGSQPAIAAPALDKVHEHNYFTNAIIDSGASGIVLTAQLYNGLIAQLIKHNAGFAQLLAPFKELAAQQTGIDSDKLALHEWPDIHFTFTGAHGEPVTLTCSPDTYWQCNTPLSNKSCFKIFSQLPHWPNQSIIGLPLLNNYYVIFDRSSHRCGEVKFARQATTNK